MNFDDKDFKLVDCYKPSLTEGKYTVETSQQVNIDGKCIDKFTTRKDFYVTANTETLSPEEVFSVYPIPGQHGDFSGTLPFIVLNSETYPWIRNWHNDIDGVRVPWLALIVVSDGEGTVQSDVKYSQLPDCKKEEDIFFPYEEGVSGCKNDDIVHLVTIPVQLFYEIMPTVEELSWLTHAKYVNLSATEDSITEKNGWFSTIVANRFVPESKEELPLKSTVHLIAVDKYLDSDIVKKRSCDYIRFVSLYHWDIYSEATKIGKSFVSLTTGLKDNSRCVCEKALKPHYTRTGEKTYSFYSSPLLPFNSERYDNINGEEKFTADGRLIYDCKNGIFDVSYSTAFNLGRLITLSRRSEAEKIVSWRRNEAVNNHLNSLESSISVDVYDVEELCRQLTAEI